MLYIADIIRKFLGEVVENFVEFENEGSILQVGQLVILSVPGGITFPCFLFASHLRLMSY